MARLKIKGLRFSADARPVKNGEIDEIPMTKSRQMGLHFVSLLDPRRTRQR
jgi:hypothetical protein